jgi:hypothetical protein
MVFCSYFSESLRLWLFLAFIIGMSGVNFLNISTPLWTMIESLIVSFFIEKDHFEWKRIEEKIEKVVKIVLEKRKSLDCTFTSCAI